MAALVSTTLLNKNNAWWVLTLRTGRAPLMREITNVSGIGGMATLKVMSATKKQLVSQLEIIGEIDAGVHVTIA
jgi:hypothetical protein